MAFAVAQANEPDGGWIALLDDPVDLQLQYLKPGNQHHLEKIDVHIRDLHRGPYFTFGPNVVVLPRARDIRSYTPYTYRDLPAGLRVRFIMALLTDGPSRLTRTLRRLIEMENWAAGDFSDNFQTIYEEKLASRALGNSSLVQPGPVDIRRQGFSPIPLIVANSECNHLIFRILELQAPFLKPFEQSCHTWVEWLDSFRFRHHGPG